MTIIKNYNEIRFNARTKNVSLLRYLFDTYIYNYVTPDEMHKVFSVAGKRLVSIFEEDGEIIIRINRRK